jgi:pimeloyl-ACP methyl ester carboxylesterase
MKETICWLPGWASDFSLWKEHIESRFPRAEHLFVGYEQMLEARNALHELPEVRHSAVIASWSLGSLLALRAAPNLALHQSIIAICPIGWFCHPELGWPTRVLKRMITQLEQNPRAVLESFATQMGTCTANEKSAWVENALLYPLPSLVLGLQLLEVEIISGLQTIAKHRPIHLIAGAKDSVVTPELTLWLEREITPQSIQILTEMSHWPFSGNWAMPV